MDNKNAGAIVETLKEVAERTSALARQKGADAAEVLISSGSELSVKVRRGEVELVHEAASKGLGLRVFRDHRAAVTYTSDLAPDALERFVAETVGLAAYAEPDELNELPPVVALAKGALPDLQLFDPAVPEVDAKEAIRRCREAEAAALAFSPKVTNSEGASWSRTLGATAFANSAGFVGGYRGSYVALSVEPICDDADGKKRNGSWWTADRYLGRLQPAAEVGREAARRTVAKLGAQKIATGALPVVFDPEAGRGLLRLLFSVVSGGAIYRKSSYLLGREGSQVASPLVHIVDDPLLPRAPGSRPYDGEGLPTRRNVVVEAGLLRTYLLDTYSARKLGRESNGCAGRGVGGAPAVTTSNFILERGTTPAAALLQGISRGLYVTEMMGFGFNPVTGDFSRGAGGFLIENGALGHPVSEVTVSANFDELWQEVDAVGDDLDLRSSVATPSFRVAKMMIAGT